MQDPDLRKGNEHTEPCERKDNMLGIQNNNLSKDEKIDAAGTKLKG
ncbi:MAG: hypothetical protein SPJ97_02565 [Bacteroides sp.]|nr:hypothetical protein [Bacteroides sp.]